MNDEERFLEIVRRFKHIGYGRMGQIVNYEWSESQPDRAAMEFALDREAEIPTEAMFNSKRDDPLSHMWKRFSK